MESKEAKNSTGTKTLADKAFYYGLNAAIGVYRSQEERLRKRVEKGVVTKYDDQLAQFQGGEMELLTERNYEKALRNLWKAEVVAPYLGLKDASRADTNAAKNGTVVAAPPKGKKKAQSDEPAQVTEIKDLVEVVTSEEVRREFEEGYTPEQRNAVLEIMSLLGHGEAYALYTSATLLPMLSGTGSKLGMSMQVLEEAKHFVVLREMLNTLDHIRPLRTSARMLFENIARQKYYNKLFGMNVVLESAATNLFSHFEKFPGLRHIMRAFHMDESRHVAFPQTYAKLGNIPEEVTNSPRYQFARLQMILPALPLFFDYKPYFDAIDVNVYHFWGRFLSKVTRGAENARMPLPQPRKVILQNANNFFNNYVRVFEPERWQGYEDYTLLKEGDISVDMAEREKDVYGRDLFDGIGLGLQGKAPGRLGRPRGERSTAQA
ncbi:MAG: hypothetical protein AB1405_16950 [Bdellovibrionota bacterium]